MSIRRISLFAVGLAMVGAVLSPIFDTTAYALSSDKICQSREAPILGINPWYKNLLKSTAGGGGTPDNCEVTMPNDPKGGKNVGLFVTVIVLNIIQAALAVVAYVTVFFIIKGGFKYMTSTGSSDGMQSAKKTISNAVIGLVIAILSASIVNAIGGAIR